MTVNFTKEVEEIAKEHGYTVSIQYYDKYAISRFEKPNRERLSFLIDYEKSKKDTSIRDHVRKRFDACKSAWMLDGRVVRTEKVKSNGKQVA